MKTLCYVLLGWITTFPVVVVGQTSAPALYKQPHYLALDVHNMTGFHRYRYLEGDEIRFRASGDSYRSTIAAVTDSSFSIYVQNEIMDRTETLTFRFNDVDRIYRRNNIPFITQLGVVLPVAGVTYALADFVNAKGLDGRSGRFLFDPQSLIPSGAMIVAGAIFYKLSRPTYTLGKRSRLRAF